MKRFRRPLTLLGFIIPVIAFAVITFGVYTARRSFPQLQGNVHIAGLHGAVDVWRDKNGIPHIYADEARDLFLAQGYVHAQDRFYQMDFWRHITAGNLAELYGGGQITTTRFLRALGWQRVAALEYDQLDPDSRAIMEAYANGVNAYLATRSTQDLSLEYSILALNGLGDYVPEPWTAVHSIAWGKSIAWDLGGNMDEEIRRAVLLQTVGPDMLADYLPNYPDDHPPILPDPALGAVDWPGLGAALDTTGFFPGPLQEGLGSNNWVIAGTRTGTGAPLLANDPHLAIQMPAIWYEVGLHCRAVSAVCPYDVVGFSMAGVPGVIAGHNARIAWGVTNVGPDVQDLYIEKLNPANPFQYEVNGQWVDMRVLTETIKIKGQPDEALTIRYTRHGPIISDVYERAGDLTGTVNGVALDKNYAVALRWTALEPGRVAQAILGLNRAQNFDDFRHALRDFAAPSQNFVYADVDGNIGYQVPSNIPIRKNGDGQWPVPGWTDEYEWTGYIPFDELPYSYNPPQGYIATANNAVVGSDYPYLLTYDWDAGYRAERIVQMIEAQPKISIDDMKQMQGDNMNLGAQELMPYLLALKFDDPKLADAQTLLSAWDFQMHMDSAPAALYASFFRALTNDTFKDELSALPSRYWPNGGALNWLALRNLATTPDNPWWDDVTTSNTETRDDIFRRAFADGYADVVTRLGADATKWKWGDLHTSTFANATVGSEAVPGLIRDLFNRGPFPTSGGASIVNATNWRLTTRGPNPYIVTNVPSMRMIVDLGNFSNSLAQHTTGQSGHAYNLHYIDFADAWRKIEYHPMHWNLTTLQNSYEGHLVLEP
jgi:penicillin amidase